MSHAGDSLVLKRTIKVDANLFSTDPIGNIYLVKNKNHIIKLNADGDSLGIFNDVGRGAVSQIDATNPLRVLVFYSDYSQIVILDNLLSQKNALQLGRIGLFNVPCIANSADANIWVLDPSGRLLKIDDRLNVRYEMPLRNLLNHSINPTYMVEHERKLYMADSLEGSLIFDRFGFYEKTYPFFTPEMQVMGDYLIYRIQDSLLSYNMRSLHTRKIPIPNPSNVRKVRFERNQLYVLREKSFDIYTLKEN